MIGNEQLAKRARGQGEIGAVRPVVAVVVTSPHRTLHTRAGELAIALAAMLEDRGGAARAVAALERLDAELGRVLGDRPRVA